MLEIRQNEARFFEVTQEGKVRYTCLKREDAEDFKERHANDPPPAPLREQRPLSGSEMAKYIEGPGIGFKTHYRDDVYCAFITFPDRSERWEADHNRWHLKEVIPC